METVKTQKGQYTILVKNLKENIHKRKHPAQFPAFQMINRAKEIGNNPCKIQTIPNISVAAADCVPTNRVIESIEKSSKFDNESEKKIEDIIKKFISYPTSTGLIEIQKLANLEGFFLVIFI